MKTKKTILSQKSNNTPYKEKASLHSFYKIKSAIKLDWIEQFTFFVHALLGAIILPLTLKLCVETIAEFAYTQSLEHAESIAPLFKTFIDIFQYVQWPLYAIVVGVYWFRCNVKAYNYSFTQSACAQIREQLKKTNKLICPRCGMPMKIHQFSEKIREQIGTHDEYYTEWVNDGNGKIPVRQKRTVSDYAKVNYTRQYAECSNQYCMYSDKRPSGSDLALYKFAEMPYKIPDTINYAVRTKAKTNMNAGNIRQYAHGISLLWHIVICVLLFVICKSSHYACINFLYRQKELYLHLTTLAITEGVVLIGGIIAQIIIHARYPKDPNNYMEIKNQDKDGMTVVLPDGSEFYAKTDHRLQSVVDGVHSYDIFGDPNK